MTLIANSAKASGVVWAVRDVSMFSTVNYIHFKTSDDPNRSTYVTVIDYWVPFHVPVPHLPGTKVTTSKLEVDCKVSVVGTPRYTNAPVRLYALRVGT